MNATTFSRLRAVAAKSPITQVRQVPTPLAGALFILALALLVAATNTPSASAQTVTYAGSGAVNFGSANVCPAGKTTPAPCSQTLTLTYNVTESGTLGTPQALTTGAPGLDYKLASGSTCSGPVTKGSTCKVNVAFAPIAPGQRNGAVEILDATGNLLASTYIYGSGIGPLAGLAPPYQTPALVSNARGRGIAVDASGDIFLAGFQSVQEILAVNGSIPANPVVKTLTDKYAPYYLALDGAGNVFFTTLANPPDGPTQSLVEIVAAGGYAATRVIAADFTYPWGVAVDPSGDVFVADVGDYQGGAVGVYEFAAAGDYTTQLTLGGGFAFLAPTALAVDGAGNLYVFDQLAMDGPYYGVVDELLASGGYASVKTIHVSNDSYTDFFPGLAIDPAGNLYYTINDDVAEAVAVNGVVPANPAILYFGSFSFPDLGGSPPFAIALDSRGNIFATADDSTGAALFELQFSPLPPLAFAQTYVGQTSADSPQAAVIQNRGNANLQGTALSVSANWEQVPGSGTPADCAAGFSLAPAAECDLSISFKPTEPGNLTGAITIVDNSLNAPGSTQSGALSGVGIAFPPPQIRTLNNLYGSPYSVLQVVGTDFGPSKGSSTVTFNGIAAPVCHWYPTNILVTVPGAATTGNVVVTVGGEASNPFPFTVLPMPVVTGISPTSGPVGTIVTISGDNLVDYGDQATVTFDSKYGLAILSESSTAIKVAIPTGATTGHFHVLVNDTGMNSPTFTVTP